MNHFSPKPPSTLYMRRCQFSYKALGMSIKSLILRNRFNLRHRSNYVIFIWDLLLRALRAYISKSFTKKLWKKWESNSLYWQLFKFFIKNFPKLITNVCPNQTLLIFIHTWSDILFIFIIEWYNIYNVTCDVHSSI